MREIKFRAWDKEEKRWVKGIILDQTGTIYISDINSEIEQIEDIDIVFYTGLKDKNGKEIYERDILYYANEHLKKYGIIFWDKKQARFCFDLILKFNSPKKEDVRNKSNNLKQRDKMEVIGNIYENKDLIK